MRTGGGTRFARLSAGDAGLKSAFQAVPALFLGGQDAVSLT